MQKKKKQGRFTPGNFELTVKRSRTGLGLFAYNPIKKGECVVEYTGRTISKKEEYESNSLYLFEVNKHKTIDGASRSNIARYINHACKPNCEVTIWGGHVWVLARRAIKPGEELNYDYDTEYFNEHIKQKGCKCASCVPVLHREL